MTVARMCARFVGTLCLALLSALCVHAADGDAAAGMQKKRMCEGCHGKEGYRTAYPTVYSAPKLGAQNAPYIVKALQDYRSGARQHPSMNGVAASLSDQDMADLAAYYSAQGK